MPTLTISVCEKTKIMLDYFARKNNSTIDEYVLMLITDHLLVEAKNEQLELEFANTGGS